MAWELIKKWCSIGTKTAIPQSQDGAIANRASYDEGFPVVCSENKVSGGKPPRREDINQILYLTSANLTELQSGNYPTFNTDVSTFLGGYPLDSVLWSSTEKCFVRSTKANNTDNFITTPSFLGNSWVKIFPANTTPFCVNSGNTDVNGDGDLVSFTGNILSFKVGIPYSNIKATTANGINFEISSISDIDFTGVGSGTYFLFIKPDGTVLYTKNFYLQKAVPASPLANAVWLDTSKEQLTAYVGDGSSWNSFDGILFSKMARSISAIVSAETIPFNYNGYTMNRYSLTQIQPRLSEGVGIPFDCTIPRDGNLYVGGTSQSNNDLYLSVTGSEGTRIFTIVSSNSDTIVGGGLFVPVKKGDVISLYHTFGTGSLTKSIIYYANLGAN